MKKFIVLMITAMFMASCSGQQLYDEFSSASVVPDDLEMDTVVVSD